MQPSPQLRPAYLRGGDLGVGHQRKVLADRNHQKRRRLVESSIERTSNGWARCRCCSHNISSEIRLVP